MCIEFVHLSGSSLRDKLAALLPANNYFLIAIGDINYLYCDDAAAVIASKAFLRSKKIRLYKIPADEMISVIDFPGMDSHQAFYGNRSLLAGLRQQCGRGGVTGN